jgi:uncharacterized protein
MGDAPAPRPSWLAGTPGNWSVLLHVQPGASRSASAGTHDGCLKLRIAAPPIDGRANDAVRAFLSERLGVAKAAIRIEHGDTSRRKRVRVMAGCSEAELIDRLGA